MAIKVASAKAKGRRLQQWVVEQVKWLHPELEDDDCQSRAMGSQGEDVMLSPAARKLFPYSVECKARKTFATLYDFLEQAKGNAKGAEPLVILRQDRGRALAMLDAEHFFSLLARLKR